MTEPIEPAESTEIEVLDPETLDVHAKAIWDNMQALTKARLASMYGADESLKKDEMVSELVRQYLATRG